MDSRPPLTATHTLPGATGTAACAALLLVACATLDSVPHDAAAAAFTKERPMAAKESSPAGSMAREPDYEAVMAREFNAATAEGTRHALIRFIARHPVHAYADQARALLDAHPGMPSSRPGPVDPDADIFSAFDRARQVGTAEAYRSFIERYAPHPLTEEAERLQRAHRGR